MVGKEVGISSSPKAGGKADPVWDEDIMVQILENGGQGPPEGGPAMMVELIDGTGKGGVLAWTEVPLFPLDLVENGDEADEAIRVVWYPLVLGGRPSPNPGLPKDLKKAGQVALQLK